MRKVTTKHRVSTMVNNSSFGENVSCVTSFSEKLYLYNYQRFILMFTDVTIMILNLTANTRVLLVLVKSKFVWNTSYMLIFYLSFSDCCLALFVQLPYAIMIQLYFDKSYCIFEMVLQFLSVTFLHISFTTIAAIGFDRYARIRYLKRYTEDVTKKKVIIACISIGIHSLFQGTSFVLGSTYKFFDISRMIAAAADILIVLFIIIVYLYSVKIIKDHQRRSVNRDLLKSVNKKIITLASKILVTIGIFYGIYAVSKVAHVILKTKVKGPDKSWLYFTLHLSYLMLYCNSLGNAIVFLTMDQRLMRK